ncbi:MAG: signal peptidase II [Gammaproteobacteria bacterium]
MKFKTTHWLLLAIALVVLDQLTKYCASAWLNYAEPVAIFPGLNFTLAHNTGAAFSLLSDASGWQRWFFAGIALVVSVVITAWLRRIGDEELWLPFALSLILGGAIGNFIDRLNFGYVVDFIQVYYKTWYWPAFNIADSAICVGAVVLVLSGWQPLPKGSPEA